MNKQLSGVRVNIYDLIDRPQHVPTLARWVWDEWERTAGRTLEHIIDDYHHGCQRNALPWALVAEKDGMPIGTMCLDLSDLPECPDLSPWAASQYVIKEYRGKGVAKALADALEARARGMGFKRLHMWTEHNPALYARFGYKILFPSRWFGRDVMVLAKDLAS